MKRYIIILAMTISLINAYSLKDNKPINVNEHYENLLKDGTNQERFEFVKLLLDFGMEDKAVKLLRAIPNKLEDTKESLTDSLIAFRILRDLHDDYIKEHYPEVIDKESYKKYSSAAYTRSNDFKIDINEDVDLIIHEASYLLAMPSIYISTTMKYNSEKITKENKQKMVDFIKELISEGNKRAKLTLGEWYLWGVGVEQNDQKGAKLLVEVSDTFYKASKILADYYFSKNDKENFIKYSKKASSLGNSSSSYNVGLEYTGNKEYKKAVKYFILSIEQDTKNYDVYYDLGRMYANGYGVEKNYDTAITLIKIAHNNTKTKDILDKSFEMLGIVHTNKAMDAHSKNDFKKAYENYTIAYEQYNDSMAAYKIAVMYFNGEYVKKDDAKTIEYYRKSADLGYRNAQFWIGFRYAIGKGVEKDLDKAIKYISLSAEQSFDMAQMMLWMWYDNGYHTIKQDKAKAKEYLRKAVDQGSKEAKVYWDKAYGK